MISKKIIAIKNIILESTKKMIVDKKTVSPTLFILSKKGNIKIISVIDIPNDKYGFIGKIKQMLVREDMIGYILILDTYMTTLKEAGEKKRTEAIVCSVYTAKDRLTEAHPYINGKFLKDEMVVHRGRKHGEGFDQWDLWGVGVESNDETDIKAEERSR